MALNIQEFDRYLQGILSADTRSSALISAMNMTKDGVRFTVYDQEPQR